MDTLVRTDPAQNVRNNIAAVIVVAVPVAVPVFFEEQSTSCPPSICSSLAVLRINNIVTAEAREQVISAISTADPDPGSRRELRSCFLRVGQHRLFSCTAFLFHGKREVRRFGMEPPVFAKEETAAESFLFAAAD